MPTDRDILHLLRHLSDEPDVAGSLRTMAERAGWSRFHFHRAFRRVVGETPKQYTLRLKLERAAARLSSSADSVRRIAADERFASTEVFIRAFRRRFGRSPGDWRRAALPDADAPVRARHAAVVQTSAPCAGLFHLHLLTVPRSRHMPVLSLERRDREPAHALVVRARCARHELAAVIGASLGQVVAHAHASGAAFAGRPFVRYLSAGPGLLEIEPGMVIASAGTSGGDVEAIELPGGPAIVALHGGAYDQLAETYAEMERWAAANDHRIAGAPWESYITDPAEHPDPSTWRTEVIWPIAAV